MLFRHFCPIFQYLRNFFSHLQKFLLSSIYRKPETENSKKSRVLEFSIFFFDFRQILFFLSREKHIFGNFLRNIKRIKKKNVEYSFRREIRQIKNVFEFLSKIFKL